MVEAEARRLAHSWCELRQSARAVGMLRCRLAMPWRHTYTQL